MEVRGVRRILVTVIGSSVAPAVVRELKEEDCYAVGADTNPAESPSESMEVQVFYQLPCYGVREEYLQGLGVATQRE